jgi:hypothetical protein
LTSGWLSALLTASAAAWASVGSTRSRMSCWTTELSAAIEKA